MRKTILPVSILALTIAACGTSEPADDAATDGMAAEDMAPAAAQMATATLMTPEGATVGTVNATGSAGGVTIDVEATGLEPGLHGVHVHETGICADDFSSAGGHWNPEGASHGLEGAEGQHAGDMPNLEIGEDGTGSLTYMLSMAATWEGLMDEDGSAFIIHSGEDDQVTDPSGNSGERLACGVFAAAE